MGWDGTGTNCYGMEWNEIGQKNVPWTSLTKEEVMETVKNQDNTTNGSINCC